MMVRVRKDSVGILGLSRSGLGCAKLYSHLGFKVRGFDDNYNLTIPQEYSQYFYEVYLGKQPQYVINEIKNYKFLVVSPGVPFDHHIIQFAKSVKVPVISEVEAAYKAIPQKKMLIGITGTNGKSTVSALTYQLIKAHDDNNIYLGGNIGYPFSEIAYQCIGIDDPTIILELSSFQLKMTNYLRTQIALITNITSDHLDRHITLQDYVSSKLKLFYFQLKKDYCIININDENTNKHIDRSVLKSAINYFSRNYIDLSTIRNGLFKAFYRDGVIFIRNLKKQRDVFQLDLSEVNNPIFKQEGIYLDNLIPSLLASFIYLKVIKKSDMVDRKVVEVLDNFAPLEYRLKPVTSWANIEFFNDSKATNLAATKSSIETVKNYFIKNEVRRYGIILLIGGVPKYPSKEELWKEIEQLSYSIKDDIVGVISFGKYADIFISPFIKQSCKYMYAFNNLESAFYKAISLACLERENFDRIAILLAPGGASFDEFKSAEERGKWFEKLVESFLKQGIVPLGG
ncbi:MAG: UDP-N-acetylmuramoyl-L-alanine--D-glutamate ligase [Candidatus Calescibacterium sp.]|nr:UDP-N-acetylmuramoyl-L-alanine--D-glutamate ligase [Candidatus Calescibacterium sp.]MCX7972164.1 UDP-N-acetylmuramoyl-L-alanine--D-glutamate ligase [bacterium]MDW8194853.1 UDP-N-acetylmuramoyl-L-alanine--D-glutamate ligase [Candidatus Calescibacterium sp.]